MKKVFMLMTLSFCVFIVGCTAPTVNIKTVSIIRDADGKVIQTIETEGVNQSAGNMPLIKFHHFTN